MLRFNLFMRPSRQIISKLTLVDLELQAKMIYILIKIGNIYELVMNYGLWVMSTL